MRKILTQFDYSELVDKVAVRYEFNSGKDIVDRSDFVSPDLQYYRLALAGIQLRESRAEMYDSTEQDQVPIDEVINTDKRFTKFMDKLEVVNEYKAKLEKKTKFENDREHLHQLEREYLAKMREIELNNSVNREKNKDITEIPKRTTTQGKTSE